MGIYGLNFRQTPLTTLALSSCLTMAASCLLPGSPTLWQYLGVAVLDVVRGERVFD
jgi:hypothetical protein